MGDNAYKQRHKELGLCVCCSAPSRLGHVYCIKHLRSGNESKRLSVKRRRAKWREEGKCAHCGVLLHEEMDAGCIVCLYCRGGFKCR